jgi:hypothetical protein
VLSVRPKITELNFNLFARNVHPELFEVCAARTYVREKYELDLRITTDGHLICFRHDGLILAEVSASSHHPLPSQCNLISHSIEKSSENSTHYKDIIRYRSSVQLDAVNPKMFVVIQQQLGEKMECEGLVHRFQSNGRIAVGAVSYINVQSFRNHVLVRSFHTFPDTCMVLKSESRFTLEA